MSLPNGIFYNKGAITMADLKKAMALVAACVFLTACGAKAETTTDPYEGVTPDFRNVNWGMSVDDVKSREDALLFEEDNFGFLLGYSDINVMEHPATLEYSFKDGKLSNATYSLGVTESEDYQINNAFFEIADGISAKYGDPDKETLCIYCGKDAYYEPRSFTQLDNFSFDVTEYNNQGEYFLAIPIYSIEWKSNNTKIQLDMDISRNGDDTFSAPQIYKIKYSAIDVDNAL